MSRLDAGAERDLFEQLAARAFYVVDTEFCTDTDGHHHVISIGVVPVVGGRRTSVGEELYRVMNPGVPIDAVTSTKHGFTDRDVADMPPFAHYARVIAERLRDDGAVFVCHTAIDAHVLRAEYQRLDERAAAGELGITVGLADLPDLPVLDTQRLVASVSYPGVRHGSKVSLDRLCDTAGVARTAQAHHARADARATADALVAMLRHAAARAAFWTCEDLLASASAGTLHEPVGPSRVRGRARRRSPVPAVPADHLARHDYPLTDPVQARSAQVEAWVERATECATLGCPHLREEARAAAPANAAVLLRPLLDELPHMNEPGHPATLLGAVHELLEHSFGTPAPALPARSVLHWWRSAHPDITASAPCEQGRDARCCPSCREGSMCPRDSVRLLIAEAATVGERGELDDERIRTLLAPTPKSPVSTWRKHHRDILAFALWRAANHQFDQGHDEAAYTTVEQGIAMGLHLLDPRLAELACDQLVEQGQPDKAFDVASVVLAGRNTDPAFDDLASWVTLARTSLYAQQPPPPAVINEPRRARPPGHTNPRQYS